MDDMNPPKKFEDHNTERKIFVCGHLNMSIRTLMGSEKFNDRQFAGGSLYQCYEKTMS